MNTREAFYDLDDNKIERLIIGKDDNSFELKATHGAVVEHCLLMNTQSLPVTQKLHRMILVCKIHRHDYVEFSSEERQMVIDAMAHLDAFIFAPIYYNIMGDKQCAS